jgi:hypothetical protein
MSTHERELTGPVALALPSGRLNPAAVGWTRHHVVEPTLPGWGRRKRWEYWGVVTERFVVGLTVSSLDYAGVHGIYLLDRATGRSTSHDAVVPLTRGTVLPPRCGAGRAHGTGSGLVIDIVHRPTSVGLTAYAPGVAVDLVVGSEPVTAAERESMGVVIPLSGRRFQYTVKDVGRPVSGHLEAFGERHEVTGFAVLDHGRGKWPYAVTWNWAAGWSSERQVGLTVGGQWTVGTGLTENALIVDGTIHKIGEELSWTYDRRSWLSPWRIHGTRLDVAFTPEHERVARTNLGVIANETHQCFGSFTGWGITDDGERLSLDGVYGWAEEARNRW